MPSLQQLRRAIAFARHVPPQQLLRRIRLAIQWRANDRFGKAGPPRLHATPPGKLDLPHLHSPRGRLERDDAGWRAVFLGVEKTMGERIDWNMRADDSKAQLWRMNLHYFEYLPDVGADDAVALIDDWIECCRPFNRASTTAGWTPYAISLRMSAWLDTWSRIGPFGDAGFQARFAGSLREQADYLVANLETDVRGNHLAKNIRALVEVGLAFDDDEARGWRTLADCWLAHELDAQILDDGLHFERSPSYHAQVFADLLTVAAIRPKDWLSEKLEDALDRMAQALADLTHPDGLPAQFNDAGLNMTIAASQCLAAYTTIRGRPAPSPRASFALAAAGYYGLRSDDDYLVVKMGKLAPDALMAHGHGDWGSFEWSHRGRRIVVDQGVFEYVAGEKRRLSRSATAHNTAVIDGHEPADFFGAFRCGVRPGEPRAEFSGDESGFRIAGSIDIATAKPTTRHERSISFDDGRLVIDDGSDAGANTPISASMLLHPDVEVEQTGARALSMASIEGAFDVVLVHGDRMVLEDAEWWPNMGQSIKTRRIRAHGNGRIRVEITAKTR